MSVNQNVATIRIGANSGSGRNAVVIFPLPVLGAGEQVVMGELAFHLAGNSGNPTFNGDLWGIGFQSSTTPILEYFEANTGDAGNTKLEDNILTGLPTLGWMASTNAAAIGAYLQTFYASHPTYAGGTYVFLRLNPDADAGTTSIGWSISAYESGTPAVLTITASGGPTNLPPEITGQPQSQSVVAGANVSFAVTSGGSEPLAYRWRFNGVPLTDGGRISGAATATLSIASVGTNDAGSYGVIVTNAYGSTNSEVATLGVYLPNTESTTNFIVIITDDQGWDSLGVVQREMGATGRFPCFTNGTPNMDRLAAQGIRFRNAFVTMSLCSPSRAAVLTGRYNHFNGVINNSTAFPTNSVTWATQLRAAGYVTGMVGKWHMGTQSARPGFDYTASYIGQGNYDASLSAFYVNGVPTANTGWVDDVASDYAIDFINAYCTNSFALLLGYKSSHTPHTAPAWAADLYTGCSAQPTPNSFISAVYRSTIFTPTDARVQNYHECLTAADVGVGRILDRLDQLGLATNTMVVFLGDNGFYLGAHGLDDKRTLYEESLRIPMLVRYPRLITQPAARDDLVLNIDIAPTILDLAGVAVPADMQGRSWRPLFSGGVAPDWRQTFLAEYILEPGYEQIPTTVTLRTTGAKYTLWPGHPEWSEMFDLTTDPYEVNNLFNVPAQQAMRAALRSEFDLQMHETGLGAQLTPLGYNNGAYQVSVTSGMGPRWELQRSADLQTWNRVGEVKMGGQQATMSDPSAGTMKNSYRLEWIGD